MVDWWDIEQSLGSVIDKISDQNYEQSLTCVRFWLNLGKTYEIPTDSTYSGPPGYCRVKTPSDVILDAIWSNRTASSIDPGGGKLDHPTAHLILRLARDVESDHVFAPHADGLQNRLSTKILLEFYKNNPAKYEKQPCSYLNTSQKFCADANLLAHCANLGLTKEDAIRDDILQSLISHPKLSDHQASALIVLFKLAGATFEAYAGHLVVNRCFKLLRDHDYGDLAKTELMREVVVLRELDWEGLPPPPTFATKRVPTVQGQKDPSATPTVTSLGLPNRDFEPQISQQPPPESVASETDTVPASPSIDVSTLSDFTITDPSDDEPPIDPAAVAPHETFYLEDGNVEVLCGSTLFRVHTSVLSFQSPALRRMFTQTALTSAESINDCPRIRSSDLSTDFATLLKTVYLPGFLERNKVPDFVTFSSLLRITSKYELPTVRSRLLEVIRDSYPETFEGLVASKPLGESVFSGSTPHPNEVLNLFVQQKLGSALPMAYYMAARRGLDSLMDRHLPRNAILSPEVLQCAVRGLIKLREMERDETYRLIFESKETRYRSTPNCPSCDASGTVASQTYQKVFDHVVGSPQLGTKVLQVPAFYEDCGGGLQCVCPGICRRCVERWESGHADLRKKAWTKLPDVFGLKG